MGALSMRYVSLCREIETTQDTRNSLVLSCAGAFQVPNLQGHRPVPAPRPSPSPSRPVSTAPAPQLAGPSQSKRARKDRGPNWSSQEIIALIAAKRIMFLEEVDTIDGRDLMTPENTKWLLISNQVMRAGFSPCVRDRPACKSKWNQLLPNFKRIADYLSRTSRNVPDYWDLSSTERQSESLPRHFAQEFFYAIHEWYGNRPQMRPPHVRDLLSPNDKNYQAHEGEQEGQEENSEEETEDPMAQPTQEASENSTPPRSPPVTSRTASRGPAASISVGNPTSQPYPGVLAGVQPQVISSSGNSSYSLKCRPGNTAVRRKNLSGHTVIAEATKATGAVMAQHMHEIA